MGLEIERKFLVDHEKWSKVDKGTGVHYRQGYLLTDPQKTIRVRLTDTRAWLTIKGISKGATRAEYEYEIPASEASELLDNLSVSELSKIRYRIEFDGNVWEVDEFSGENQGLIVAEIELTSEDEQFVTPGWITKEVTGEERYYNSNLSIHPYSRWNA